MPFFVPCYAGHSTRKGRMRLKLLNRGTENWYACENPHCTYHYKWMRAEQYYYFHRNPDAKKILDPERKESWTTAA